MVYVGGSTLVLEVAPAAVQTPVGTVRITDRHLEAVRDLLRRCDAAGEDQHKADPDARNERHDTPHSCCRSLAETIPELAALLLY